MASILKVDTLTGVATAGSIAVTGEGNSTTTNLQQGLAKAWAAYDMTGTANIKDSINISSLADNDTGECQLFISNSFSNANYATATCGGGSSITDTAIKELGALDYSTARTTGLIRLGLAYANSSLNRTKWDSGWNDVTFHGDLA